jgi:hypothetical protein
MPRISTVLCGYNSSKRARTVSACHIASRLSREAMISFPENLAFNAVFQ